MVSDCTAYVVRGVIVDGTAVTPVNPDGVIEVSGETTAIGQNASDVYLVTYEQGEKKTADAEGNPIAAYRTDTITNTMPVLTVNKTDPDGTPLAGAVFRLLKSDKKNRGHGI